LRDARTVADVLVEGDDWSPAAFGAYAEERSERMRRLRVAVSVMNDLRCDFSPAGRARRLAFFSGLLSDAMSIGLMVGIMGGPEVPDPEIFDKENVDRILAMA
jgi:2-polyprenyl-6-methoxyphenol hydroxylase-like FAD-dependent oxidoreductase